MAGAGALLLLLVALAIDFATQGYAGWFGSGHRTLARAQPKSASVNWTVVARGFPRATDIQFVPGLAGAAVVLQQTGEARLLTVPATGAAGAGSSPLVFEVEVHSYSELGLLGLAFHPRYEQNGLLYVNYTPKGPLRTRIAEWKLERERLGKERAKELRVLLEVEQPYSNHNAGQLAFGPDGMLYIGLGDGGSADDPHGHGQNLGTLLGSLLRIDVDRRDPGLPYAIPKDNPFVQRAGARPEIWAYGLRNPWRYSFDPRGRLIAADVGQNHWEEVDIVERGANLGWNRREGRHCFPIGSSCDAKGLVDPIFEYPRSDGISITGGYVYEGKTLSELRGKYVFGDYGSGRIWALDLPEANKPATARVLGVWPRTIATFGRDAAGEIYAGDYASGEILRLVRR